MLEFACILAEEHRQLERKRRLQEQHIQQAVVASLEGSTCCLHLSVHPAEPSVLYRLRVEGLAFRF